MRFDLISFSAAAVFVSLQFVMPPASLQAAQPELREIFSGGNEKVQVVCLGDSVTGVYYHTGGRRAYPAMVEIGLRQAFPEADINVINAGISGNTTNDGLRRLERDVLDKHPDLVTIMFSLNDMTRVPLAEFVANLKSLVDQIHARDAAVLLCTPNSVFDSTGRPIETLEDYVAAIRNFAAREKLPLADCYATFEQLRNEDEWAWTMLMSDDIHPNMGGHKLLAETIVSSISGKAISLADEAPLQPAIPNTLRKLLTGQRPVLIAMPPVHEILTEIIGNEFPDRKVSSASWVTENRTLAEIEDSADLIRTLKLDGVFIALPHSVLPGKDATELRRLSWILNKSLSFGKQEWDCVVVSPALFHPPTTDEERLKLDILRQFVANQDLTFIDRADDDQDTPAADIIKNWWRDQRALLENAE
ncbi:MAG: hypothetical protein CMJ46_15170 [Planctomyces sp.]|nr:hypothetical protein [Planctomyces sp.]